MPGRSLLQVFYEQRHDIFGFGKYKMVHIVNTEVFIPGCEKGATGNNFGPEFLASVDDFPRRILLHHHSAEEHIISPVDVSISQGCCVHIYELFIPLIGKHCCHGQQAQGRDSGLPGDEFQGMLETPESIRILWIDKEYLQESVLSVWSH